MNEQEHQFVNQIWQWYKTHGRHDLPWRLTHDPYSIVVSEIMLQQTQVDRVIQKYEMFLEKFPTVVTIAKAPLSEMLSLWQGLGYNRRAKYLHECAKIVVEKYAGEFPKNEMELRSLPGIGRYTAGAVLAFAHSTAVPIIETNIRTVYLHHFFAHKESVTDNEILYLVERTLSVKKVRDWYYALMDYGSFLKRSGKSQAHKSLTYRKQATFLGSDRQLRGAIIRLLVEKNSCSKKSIQNCISLFPAKKVNEQLAILVNEGLIQRNQKNYQLAT